MCMYVIFTIFIVLHEMKTVGLRRCGSPLRTVHSFPTSPASRLHSRTQRVHYAINTDKSLIRRGKTVLASLDNGFGGSSGGSPPFGGDGGDWGGDEGDGGKRFDFKSFLVGLLLLGLPSVVFLEYKKRRGNSTKNTGYDVDPLNSLKRLVRELFEKDVETQERLLQLEEKLGIVHDGSPGLHASKVASSRQSSKTRAAQDGSLRSMGGRLTLGGGLLWSEDADASNLDAMVESGVQLGTRLVLQSRGQFRQGKDFILTDINIDGASQEEFNLQKVLYSCGLTDQIKIMFAPFGARGNDVTYTLNPFAGRGLTAATSEGNPLLHGRGRGSVIGSTISLPRSWMSAALFRTEGEENTEKALLQAIVAPTRHLSLGMTLLEAQSSERSLREYANALLQSLVRRQEFSNDTPVGRSRMEVATTFALSVGNNLAFHGWAASDSLESLLDTQAASTTWNLSFGDKLKIPSDRGTILPRWVASIGKASLSNGNTLAPDMLEFSTEFDLGNGMSCHPGMVAVRDATSTWTVLAGAKAVWDF